MKQRCIVKRQSFALLRFGFFLGALFVLTFFSRSSVTAAGATWFVSSTGSDSNSCAQAQSAATPKRTITAGLACIGSAGSEAGAGNTLTVAAGSYSESLVDKIPSGSGAVAPFTLTCETDFACSNVLPTTGSPVPFHIGINTPTHWVIIRGFVFDGGSGTYMSAPTANTHHDITWLNNEMKNSPNGMGLQASGSSSITVIGNRIHDIGSVCGTLGPGYCHGIYAADLTANWLISQNEIYSSTGYGIHLYGSSALPSGFTVERNLLHNNGRAGLTGAGIIVYGSNHVIRNNISYSNAYEGILLRGVSNPLVYNNTTYRNGGSGISKESGVGAVCKNNLSIGDAGVEIPDATRLQTT